MLGLNNMQLMGNLGSAPEMKFLSDGKSQVVNFPVAINERWKNRDGEPQERTTWVRVVAFNGLGQTCAEHLTKGSAVYVEGRLQIREYQDKDGFQRTSVEVVASKVRFLGRGNGSGEEKKPAASKPRTSNPGPAAAPDDLNQGVPDDDIPF